MDIPNFKDIVQKLSVFKNNLSLLLPVIIVLVSVLLFVPTLLMSSKLKQEVGQESITKGAEIVQDLQGQAVSREQYRVEAERQKAHANDANAIEALAMQNTQRQLLSYDIFPEPNGSSTLVFQEFGKLFREAIGELIVRANGRDRPTDAELSRALENSSALSTQRRSSAYSMGPSTAYSMGSPRSSSGGPRGMSRMFKSDIERMILEQVCRERAASISVYVNPADLSGYDYWADYKYDVLIEKAVEDCWYHQLAYWVVEDVFDTIFAMNSEHENVLTAPVKRFLRISFTMGLKRPRSGGGVFRGVGGRKNKRKDDADKPSYVLSVSDGLTESCTGRFSNDDDDIDVVHFNVAVVVGTKSVLPFMQQLCSAKEHKFSGYIEELNQPKTYKHNQISILESKAVSVNPEELDHRYYSYGEDSVVELDLICEYIFNKKGYEEIKPESVKKTLDGEEQTTGQVQGR